VKENPVFALHHSDRGRPSDRYQDILKLMLEKQQAEVQDELNFITLRRSAQAVPLKLVFRRCLV
jgi:hypothetical protein